ncbi:D-alanyl-D-alanine carboxypeptidase family protein [Rubritalea spongiae]|uniref:D-alanyl-D-alanine carboxypeptidase family protein n=1 Tax=Rubritalea spongiae TaxID=430797 RepID=A0ABW5DXF8_9BACT
MRILVFLFGIFLSLAAMCNAQESYIVVERYSKRVLLASGTETKRPVAGLAHMATAKVVLDWAGMAGVSNSTLLTVPAHTFYSNDLNPLGLQAGDRISLRDALYATILTEDAVSPLTLAQHVGMDLLRRRPQSGSPMDVFIAEMNHLSRSLGMDRTRYYSPSGADVWKNNTFSTASDIAKLSVTLTTHSAYTFYAKQKQRTLKVIRTDGRESQVTVLNTNKLLNSSLKVEGLKVGLSQIAGQCSSVMANHDSYIETLPDGTQRVTPVQLVVVVLGSSNAEGFSKALIGQGWKQYEVWRHGGYMSSPGRKEFLKLPEATR